LCNAQKVLDKTFLCPKIGLIVALHKARQHEVPRRSALIPAIDAIAFQELDMSLLTPEQIAAAQKPISKACSV
jgi:hypothetical protein